MNKISSMDELNKFCNEFDLRIEYEKPFESMDQHMLKVLDENGETIRQVVVEDTSNIEQYAGTLLNKVSAQYPK